VVYGSQYWKEIINFDALVRHDMISPEDLKLFSSMRTTADGLRAAQGRSDHLRHRGWDARRRRRWRNPEPAETGRTGSDEGRMTQCSIARWRPGLRCVSSSRADAETVFAVVDRNREHLRQWLPWVDPLALARGHPAVHCACAGAIRGPVKGPNAGVWVDGVFTGNVGCHPISWANGNCSLGYWIAAAQQGQGRDYALLAPRCWVTSSGSWGCIAWRSGAGPATRELRDFPSAWASRGKVCCARRVGERPMGGPGGLGRPSRVAGGGWLTPYCSAP